MGFSIHIEGLDDLTDRFNNLTNGATGGLMQGLMRGGELVRAEAASNCPVDTGQLSQSITVEQADGTSVTVGTNKSYAVFVEFGSGSLGNPEVAHTTKRGWVYYNERTGGFVYTTGQAPQPFLVPALYSQRDAVIEAVKQGLLEAF